MRSIASLSTILALLARTVAVAGQCTGQPFKSWDFHDAAYGPLTQYDNHLVVGFNVTAVGSPSQTIRDGSTVYSARQATFIRPPTAVGANAVEDHHFRVSSSSQYIIGSYARFALPVDGIEFF
ncbi:MAG: hypothetical protein M1826_004865 [Phylliscum demangeonii]|nr:MAG: hypothetical protein M1826_004865 [Phylliscum demangeonii]